MTTAVSQTSFSVFRSKSADNIKSTISVVLGDEFIKLVGVDVGEISVFDVNQS